jgi:hypothetical protein
VPKLYSAGQTFGRLREIQQQLVADRLMPVFRRLPKGSPNERLHHRGSHILAPTLARYLPLRSFKLRPLARAMQVSVDTLQQALYFRIATDAIPRHHAPSGRDLARNGTARVSQIGGRLARYHPRLTGLSFPAR